MHPDANGGSGLRWSPREALDALEAAGSRIVLTSLRGGVARTWSGAQMAALVRGAAVALRAEGAGAGDVVAIWAPNSPAWIAAGLACGLSGAILAPIDAMLPADEARRQARESGARLTLIDGAAMAEWGETLPAMSLDRIAPSAAPVSFPALAAAAPIALFRTSGTTGAPKRFHLTLGAIGWNVDAIARSGEVSARDRVLLPLPMHHVFPWITATLSALTVGALLVLPESTAGPHVAEALRLTRPTVVVGVPRLYEALLAGIRARLSEAGPLALGAYEAALRLALACAAPAQARSAPRCSRRSAE